MSVFEGHDFEELEPVPSPPNKPEQILEQPKKDRTVPLQGNYDSVVLDGAYRNYRTFLRDLEGMTVTLQFYHVLRGKADVPDIADLLGNGYNAQFQYIKNYEVKFSGNKSFNKDSSKGAVTLSGSFLTYPGFTPSKFDIFTMEAGEGERYIAYLEEVIETSARKDRVTTCSFKVIDRVTPEIQAELDKRVVDRMLFVKDYLSTTPIIKESTYVALTNLKQQLELIRTLYIKDYYDTELRTFTHRTALERYYDEFTSRAFKATLPDYGRHANLAVYQYNTGYGDTPPLSLWQVLSTQEAFQLPAVFREMRWWDTRDLKFDLENNTLRGTTITQYLFPRRVPNAYRSPLLDTYERPLRPYDPEAPESDSDEVITYKGGDSKSVHTDGLYVLSGAFYDKNLPFCSELERMVWRHLDGESIDPSALFTLNSRIMETASKMDKYFYYPLLMILGGAVVHPRLR